MGSLLQGLLGKVVQPSLLGLFQGTRWLWKAALNLQQPFCLSLLDAGIIGVHHRALLSFGLWEPEL